MLRIVLLVNSGMGYRHSRVNESPNSPRQAKANKAWRASVRPEDSGQATWADPVTDARFTGRTVRVLLHQNTS